jgi:thioester reductase-like protein
MLPYHWCYKGRVDNIIVFSNGEKLNPVSMEEIITGHPAIKGALIVGQGRFQPALILEPFITPKDSAEAEALIDSIWPLVEEANKETVAHGAVVRRLVVLSDPDRPFVRAGKGTVQRSQTVDAYKDYVDSIYAHAEVANPSESIVLELSSKESLTQSIIDLFAIKIGAQGIGPDTDFFSAGVDSLQVISASHLLRSGFKAAGVHIDQSAVATRVIYGNPTPKDLACHLYAIISNNLVPGEDELARETRITADLVSKYAENLPVLNTGKPTPLDNGQTVLLTGTTGSLGAYILDRLCSLSRVKKIIALNRGHDGGSLRQLSSSAARGLGTDFSKVEFIEADLSLPNFGLPPAERMRLLATADRVIHNAWPVNFNISVASFEPHIRGVRHLVDFASAAEKRVPVVFVSSIGTVDGWSLPVSVPEQRIDDLALPQTGYGRSKLAASLILDAAADRSGVPTASVRVGQIAGPRGRRGVWNRQEYLPSLIASSVYLGVLPKHLGAQESVEWIPVEDMSELILDVAGITSTVPVSEISGYFHGVNPSTTRWADLAISLREFYAGRIKELVSLDEWVAALEKSAEMPTDTDKNPAVKLLDTYRSMLTAHQQGRRHAGFQMERTLGRSPALAIAGPITSELMKNWCEQWGF